MIHIFIVNPKAGQVDKSESVLAEIDLVFSKSNQKYYEFVTEYEGHATEIVHSMCGFFEDEIIRFYACGGLGTVCEVINGICNFDNAQLAVYPIVKETDILKAFSCPASSFRNIAALKNGTCTKIDLLKCNDKYVVNHICFGIDARVGKSLNQTSLRKLGLLGEGLPYLAAAFQHFGITKTLLLDFQTLEETFCEKCALAVVMNGIRYGRAFYPYIDAKVNDGHFNLCTCFIKSMFFNFKILSDYQSGNTLDNQEVFMHRKEKEIRVKKHDGSKLLFNYDGLVEEADELHITLLPHKLEFVLLEVSENEK